MKRNKKGFTLIELLAVIVILAIIALIAVPVIMNIINKANKSAFKDTAYGIISAGELYFAERQLDINGMDADATFNLSEANEDLQLKGEVPQGTMTVTKEGKIALAVKNGRYCITKGFDDTDVTVTEDIENCNLPDNEGGANNPGGENNSGGANGKTLTDLATTSEDLEIESVDECLTNGETCDAGTAFAIPVNEEDTYKFYVLNDDGDTVTLIMSHNVYEEGSSNSNVAWITKEDYVDAVGNLDNWIDDDWGDNSVGPLTALKELKKRTENWDNIDPDSYPLDYGKGTYSGEYVQNVRARLPRLSDLRADDIGCGTDGFDCPAWLTEGYYYSGDKKTKGYWLSDASSSMAFIVFIEDGVMFIDITVDGDDSSYNNIGIRPVITLSK